VRIETAELDQGFFALLELESMRSGGYPFAANDLDGVTWMQLGAVKEVREMILARPELYYQTPQKTIEAQDDAPENLNVVADDWGGERG